MKKANIILVQVHITKLWPEEKYFPQSPGWQENYSSRTFLLSPPLLSLTRLHSTPRLAEPGRPELQTITRNRPISILQLSWGRSGRWSRWLWCRLVTVVVLCRSDESNILAAPRSFTFVLCRLVLFSLLTFSCASYSSFSFQFDITHNSHLTVKTRA